MASRPATIRLGGAILLFGTALPVSRFVSAEMAIIPAMLLRLLTASAVLAPLLWFRRSEITRLAWTDIRLVLLIGLSSATFSGLTLCTTRLVPSDVACTAAACTPAVTAAGATLFLKDRPNQRRFLWILVAPLCLAAFSACDGCANSRGTPLLLIGGLVLAFGAVCCEAAGTLLSKLATRSLRPLTLAALSTCAATVLLLPLAFLSTESFDPTGVSMTAWTATIWWGAAALGLGTWLWYDGISRVHASTAATWLSTLPFVTFAFNLLLV